MTHLRRVVENENGLGEIQNRKVHFCYVIMNHNCWKKNFLPLSASLKVPHFAGEKSRNSHFWAVHFISFNQFRFLMLVTNFGGLPIFVINTFLLVNVVNMDGPKLTSSIFDHTFDSLFTLFRSQQ